MTLIVLYALGFNAWLAYLVWDDARSNARWQDFAHSGLIGLGVLAGIVVSLKALI